MFTDIINEKLGSKLDPKAVATRKQAGVELSYLEAWYVQDQANLIFGFDGWNMETVELVELHKHKYKKNDKEMNKVSYRAKVRIEVYDPEYDMNFKVVREGVGFGSGISSDPHDAFELAIKEAESDAMKRAFKSFGNQFGLALYDKEQKNVGDEKIEFIQAQLPLISALEDIAALDAHLSKKEYQDKYNKLSDEQKQFLEDRVFIQRAKLNISLFETREDIDQYMLDDEFTQHFDKLSEKHQDHLKSFAAGIIHELSQDQSETKAA